MNNGCMSMNSCEWYETVVSYAISYGFIGYILMSAVVTFTIILSIVRSQ